MGNIVREIDYVEMVKREPDPKAKDRFDRPAYQIKKLIRAQGGQMIEKGVDAGGQKEVAAVQSTYAGAAKAGKGA